MAGKPVTEGDLLWEPTKEFRDRSKLSEYTTWLREAKGLDFDNYHDLWQWSIDRLEDFWASLWDFFDIRAEKPYGQVLARAEMPGAIWFDGAELNYAAHVFRRRSSDRPAFMFQSERRPLTAVSWDELYRKVSSVAAGLKGMGVGRGDMVAAYMPNIPEAAIAFLACAGLGATWSSCSPDFGARAVIDRFRQIEPKVLFAVDGYQYGGKPFDRMTAVAGIQKALPSLEKTVLVPYLEPGPGRHEAIRAILWEDLLNREAELVFEPVPFDHPLWVVYSSGTTGLPKVLVHGHGGILLEFLKFLSLHMDVGEGDRFFWFSTTGWVMWNILLGGLLTGAVPVLYDGNPGYPDMDVLWRLAEKAELNVFGVSAAYLTACMKEGLEPGRTHDLGALKSIGSTGSPLPPDGFQYVYEKIKSDLWLCSVSGGTDPCTGFVGSCPWLPVHAGELQCRCLGVAADAFDPEGRSLRDQVGELVITKPMPSMPLYLMNDPDNKRYQESYFDMYPGCWRHGDWIKITAKGSTVITGRSDSTINRLGVRMGSSEIYAAVEDLSEVADSLVIGYEKPGGDYFMPLFVVLDEGATLDDELKVKINKKIRTALSPRHVPDEIFTIREVPRTLNAKKLEVPVKKILMGLPADQAVNVDSMSNPAAIDFFIELAQKL